MESPNGDRRSFEVEDTDGRAKINKAKALSDALRIARADYVSKPGADTGLALSNLLQQRRNLLGTMRLRLVSSR